MLTIALILVALLNATPFGRRIYAIGGNETAARLLGLKVDRIKIVLYVISGALRRLGGVLLPARRNRVAGRRNRLRARRDRRGHHRRQQA